jgi:hypothetical protein
VREMANSVFRFGGGDGVSAISIALDFEVTKTDFTSQARCSGPAMMPRRSSASSMSQ